jgi:hypothetical protein
MGKVVFLGALLVLLGGGYAGAACSQEELTAKEAAFKQAHMDVLQKDLQKFEEVVQAMQDELPDLWKAQNTEGQCDFYDRQIERMK